MICTSHRLPIVYHQFCVGCQGTRMQRTNLPDRGAERPSGDLPARDSSARAEAQSDTRWREPQQSRFSADNAELVAGTASARLLLAGDGVELSQVAQLLSARFAVNSVADARTAREVASATPPDIVIADCR